jgi:hypothetical protein
MPTNPYWLNPVRHPEDTGVGYLRRTVNFDTPFANAQGAANTFGVPIGGLEPGASVIGVDVVIETAFNAGTTNVLVVGTVDDDDGFAATAGTVPGTPGFKPNLQGALSGIPLATSKVCFVKYTQTGTAATTGKATVIVKFVNKREVEGTAFPAN